MLLIELHIIKTKPNIRRATKTQEADRTRKVFFNSIQEKVISIVSNLTDNCNCLYSIKKDRFRHRFLEILYGGSPRFPVFLLCFCAGFGTMLLIAFEQGGLLL